MAFQPKRIICAIDFSSLTPQAVQFAVKIAQTFQAELFLFHSAFFAKGPVDDGKFTSRAYQWRVTAPKHRDTLEQLMRGTGVAWQPLFTKGEPVEELEKAVHQYRIDLALAASHEISAIKRMFIGTVIERMVRRLTIPLVIFRHSDRPADTTEQQVKFHRILVACSATSSDQALIEAALLFAGQSQAQIHLCHAASSPMVAKVIDPTQGPYEEVQATLQKRLKERLAQYFKPASEPAVAWDYIVVPAPPPEALHHYARKFQPDLTLVGVRKKRHIGATTESVIRHAKATTIIVPVANAAHWQSES